MQGGEAILLHQNCQEVASGCLQWWLFASLEVLQQKLVMPRGAAGKSLSSSGFGDCIWSRARPEAGKGLSMGAQGLQGPFGGDSLWAVGLQSLASSALQRALLPLSLYPRGLTQRQT